MGEREKKKKKGSETLRVFERLQFTRVINQASDWRDSGHRIDSHKHATVGLLLRSDPWCIAYYFAYWHSWRDRTPDFPNGPRGPIHLPWCPSFRAIDSNLRSQLLNRPSNIGNGPRKLSRSLVSTARFFRFYYSLRIWRKLLIIGRPNFFGISKFRVSVYRERIFRSVASKMKRRRRRRKGRRDEILDQRDNLNKNLTEEWIGNRRR